MMTPPWIDISIPIRAGLPRWPGDPAPRITRLANIAKGGPSAVSFLAMPVHTGTHVDAPSHYLRRGAPIQHLSPKTTVGRARVLRIKDQKRVTARELSKHAIRKGERILLKTANSPRCWKANRFLRDFVSVSPDGADYLADRQIRLLGVDYVSVGSFGPEGDEVHRILLAGGVWVLEGLNLTGVHSSSVDLICLCLNLPGAEGAPARAYVRERGVER